MQASEPLSGTRGYTQYINFVGAEELDNTVATFYAHGIAAIDTSYLNFLGFSGNANQLITELNLPTKSTLNVLLTLLVMEHPLITPSWLAKWDLFDVNGNMVGYKQVGNQHIAVSYKSRKTTNAQQEVVLNEFSKSIVEFLIHTRMAVTPEAERDVNWRRMILTATCINVRHPDSLNTTLHSANDFYDWLQDKSLFDMNSDITKTPKPFLKFIHYVQSDGTGLKFTETRSMDAVSGTWT